MNTITTTNREMIGQTYSEVRNDIFAIFRQACIAEDICEDLVQDVFLKILGLDIIIREQLKALAVRIAYQKRTDYLRHQSFVKKAKADLGWMMERKYVDKEMEVKEIMHIEAKTVDSMSKLDSMTYQLCRYEDKSAEEVALILHISKRAVESRLYRSRSLVREQVRKRMCL